MEFAGHNRFYARNSTGKYEMDVAELKSAFTNASSISERVRDFRADRILKLLDEQTSIPFESGRKTVLHLIPLDALGTRPSYDVLQFAQPTAKLQPMFNPSSWVTRINLDGVVVFDGGQFNSRAYTQVYGSGIIEAVGVLLLSGSVHVLPKSPSPLQREAPAYSVPNLSSSDTRD